MGAYSVQGTVLASKHPKMNRTVHAIEEIMVFIKKQCDKHYNEVLYTPTVASQTKQAAT